MEKNPESATRRRIEEGRALFNARRYFEAHEVWEEAWLVEEGPTRRVLQGLIQIAAGLLKAESGAPRPCASLLGAGLEKLSAGAGDPALDAFAAAVEVSLEEARRWERGEAAGLSSHPVLAQLTGVK
jgi:hypothetical protein